MSQFAQWLSDINSGIQSTVNTITNTNYLNYAVSSGFGDVPIAAYGMTIIVLSTLAYATAADSNNLPDISNIAKNMVQGFSSSGTLSESAKKDLEIVKEDESKKIAKEEEEYQKTIEKEEAEKKKAEEEEAKQKEEEEKKKSEEEAEKNGEKKKESKEKDEDEEDEDSESRSKRGGRSNKKRESKKRASRKRSQ
jgi:outer membrane biosynthesis protein TonB